MLFGGLIYIFFRSTNLLMFDWFKYIGIYNYILFFRNYIELSFLPNWIIYSIPDGIWIYSLTSFMIIIWGKEKKKWPKIVWLSMGPVLGIGAEIGQLLSIIPGHFDLIDLFFCIIASMLPFYFLRNSLYFNIRNFF